jgi:hypothetical protein
MKWKEHTSTKEFASTFQAIMEENKTDNDKRAGKIEDCILEEAIKA